MTYAPSTPAARARRFKLAPLGALAAGFGLAQGLASAQAVAPAKVSAPAAAASAAAAAPAAEASGDAAPVMPVVRAKAEVERQGKDDYQTKRTRIGKGEQELRDIPQSITVVTEKLIDDRNLDTMKDVLRNTAGITFQAAEGGEEDIRLRGFALQTTGDVFIDGLRDPAFYDRDTFFLDRIELLRGSAGLLFGRGSTGGAVNQVTKQPYLMTEKQVDVTVGSGSYVRTVGDFNVKLGESSAVRVGTMFTKADNNGAGSSLNKRGVALAWRTGIGERHEFAATLYYLDNDNGINYGLPYAFRSTAEASLPNGVRPPASRLLPLEPDAYYGLASDRNDGTAGIVSLSHTWRLARGQEITTKVRYGDFTRDQRASTVRFAAATAQPGGVPASLETFGPNTVFTRGFQPKVQDMQTLIVQSDYSGAFKLLGMTHELQAGIDLTRERKQVYQARNAAQGGVVPPKPNTTVGTPDDGASVNESLRSFRLGNEYESRAGGVYVQDLIEFIPNWKLLAGLRYDYLTGDYDSYAFTGSATPDTRTSYRMNVSEVSRRLALLFQPSERLSFHLSGATSFNTSGDAYALSASNVDTPPEQSINVELGARANSADGNFTARAAIFRTTKLNERNTDPLINLTTLSGKRHASGFELDLTGRITPNWEVFGSYAWIPNATIDVAVANAEPQGARPALTPRHSGTIWTTYQFSPKWRAGAGVNARSGVSPVGAMVPFDVPRYVTGDVMAEFKANDQLTYKLNVSNVTDKLYADGVYRVHYVPGPGRTVAVTGNFKF
ncbi:MAG TPA: TonB-dependent siderophore receptor [Methylibium sp.]|uniref:TonB-dependent receptor n=1 Tax=Methylibium sp. TaxID=2067992 RepID=UPI002DBAFD35|nr:TonB-dependent siderophore receptor [Methylibium sp.]HEU4458496.1 TonB-dependent siderophore receptor [Methylibium sp.]